MPHHQSSFASSSLTQLLGRPRLVVTVCLILLLPLVAGLSRFRLDASSDSLVLEQDPDLRFYDDTRATFGTESALTVVVQPEGPLFEQQTLLAIENLAIALEAEDGVTSVVSITRVPLFLSPPTGLFRLADGFRTLAADQADPNLARAEILANPLYANALLSADGTTTALQVELTPHMHLLDLEQERYRLRDLLEAGSGSPSDRQALVEIESSYRAESIAAGDRRRELIERLRAILNEDRGLGLVELGGLPMITVDIVRFIERDLLLFGVASVLFVLLAVALLFRSLAWTLAITATCSLTVLALLGILGWMDWRVTVVTSNLASLLFIMTLAMSIHIAMRFREQSLTEGGLSQRIPSANTSTGTSACPSECSSAMALALSSVFTPCLFTVLTTMVGFGSLYLSRLRPVMDFALMMGMGLVLTFVLCFVLLPCVALLFPSRLLQPIKGTIGQPGQASSYVRVSRWALRNRRLLQLSGLAVMVVSVMGISRLSVENSFVDYFKRSSQIHRSLTLIDETLGGTTPLEIVLDAGEPDQWLQAERLEGLDNLHTWLQEQPEVGYVSSLHSLVQILEQIIAADPNPAFRNVKVNSFLLQMIRSQVPEEIANTALRPFVSQDYSQTRIIARVKESTPGLDREALLQRIDSRLSEHPIVPQGQQRITGMFVLYSNMLQSLFSSQVSTLGAVLFSIAAMFWLLLRSWKLALVALAPNVLPVSLVLGTLGWAGVPLDMMTIMIAAITLSISVHDTVHYLYRYQHERQTRGFAEAVAHSHDSVGRAMFATTVAVTFGFSLLTLSNFKPTIYFGLLTGLAMITALLADALLLPVLLPRNKREPTAPSNP